MSIGINMTEAKLLAFKKTNLHIRGSPESLGRVLVDRQVPRPSDISTEMYLRSKMVRDLQRPSIRAYATQLPKNPEAYYATQCHIAELVRLRLDNRDLFDVP